MKRMVLLRDEEEEGEGREKKKKKSLTIRRGKRNISVNAFPPFAAKKEKFIQLTLAPPYVQLCTRSSVVQES